tara:strand:+ start:871 stop:2103 length:1233 start_codon:yes stop_codon:yes gene_type:complete
MYDYFLIILILVILLESLLYLLIKWLKKDFQWLITSGDKEVKFNASITEKFLSESYNSELGWDRKPNKKKNEKILSVGEISNNFSTSQYSTNKFAERTNPGYENHSKKIITYGDSFAFCRHVNDNETWQHYLSVITDSNVVNLGVGNYGVDQAYRKMEMTIDGYKESAQYVVMMVVPETIVRIVNMWKHYYEYGNIYGFKGRYIHDNNDLFWMNNIVSDVFVNKNNRWKDVVSGYDYCYKTKFSRDIITFPFSLSLAKSHHRNLSLIYYLLANKLYNMLNINNSYISNRAWNHVLKCNNNYYKALYKNENIVNLLKKIIMKFDKSVKENNLQPIFIMAPYQIDISEDNSCKFYQKFIDDIKNKTCVIDLAEKFVSKNNYDKLYVTNSIGAHLSKYGNKVVAETIAKVISI